MPWRGREITRAWCERNARGALLAVLIAGAAATSLGGTTAAVEPDPAQHRLLPPLAAAVTSPSSTTTTTAVPAPPLPAPAPVVVGATLSHSEAARQLARAMAAVLPGRAPLAADVSAFATQVPPGSDPAEVAQRFLRHRYANLIDRRQWFKAMGAAAPPCRLLAGPGAASEPAFRYELAC